MAPPDCRTLAASDGEKARNAENSVKPPIAVFSQLSIFMALRGAAFPVTARESMEAGLTVMAIDEAAAGRRER